MSGRTANDCWNHIGMLGKATCPNLQEFVHCRNCPVFSREGRTLLDREGPEDYLLECTAALARQKKVEPADRISVVMFRVGREWLALRTGVLEKIVSTRPIHTIPHRSSSVLLGLANIKGELLLCASLARILGVEEVDPAELGCSRRAVGRLIVVKHDNERWVFPVDEVEGILRFSEADMENVPATVALSSTAYSQGIFKVDSRRAAFLDEHLLVDTLRRSMRW